MIPEAPRDLSFSWGYTGFRDTMQLFIRKDTNIRFNVNMFPRYFPFENKSYLEEKKKGNVKGLIMNNSKNEREADLQEKVKSWVTDFLLIAISYCIFFLLLIKTHKQGTKLLFFFYSVPYYCKHISYFYFNPSEERNVVYWLYAINYLK